MFQPVFQAMFESVFGSTLVALFLAVLHVSRSCFCGAVHNRGENSAEEDEGEEVFAHIECVVCLLLWRGGAPVLLRMRLPTPNLQIGENNFPIYKTRPILVENRARFSE